MEEAYNELYQQFLSLRSLCLKQAAMLQRLTAALDKQQDVFVPTVDFNDLMSLPAHCTSEPTVNPPHQHPLPGSSAPGQCELDLRHRNEGTFSGLIAEDTLKFNGSVSSQARKEVVAEQKHSFLSSPRTLICPEASHCETSHRDERWVVSTPQTAAPYGSSLGRDFQCPSNTALMSDVALQSHICDFCQAVFPADTTTRGEFLHHLYTHVT